MSILTVLSSVHVSTNTPPRTMSIITNQYTYHGQPSDSLPHLTMLFDNIWFTDTHVTATPTQIIHFPHTAAQ